MLSQAPGNIWPQAMTSCPCLTQLVSGWQHDITSPGVVLTVTASSCSQNLSTGRNNGWESTLHIPDTWSNRLGHHAMESWAWGQAEWPQLCPQAHPHAVTSKEPQSAMGQTRAFSSLSSAKEQIEPDSVVSAISSPHLFWEAHGHF